MDGQAMHLAEWEALGDWRMGEGYLDALRAVTAEQVQAVARQYLDPDQAGVVVYRPTAMLAIAEGVATGRHVLDQADAAAPAGGVVAPAIITGRAKAEFERESAGVQVYRTRHGVPILIRHKPGAPIVHIGAWLAGGACEEPDRQAGLTLLTARAMSKGTATRSAADLALAAESLGGSLSASAGAETAGWGISVPTAAFEPATALLADVVLHPAFAADVIETERAAALAELAQLQDDTYRYPLRLLIETAWSGHPYGTSASGTEASLRGLTRDAITAWHASHVRQAYGAIGLVGDVDPDEAADRLARAFDEWRHRPAALPVHPRWPAAPITTAVSRAKNQTALALAFEGPSRRDAAHLAGHLLSVVASGLGGRFFEALRDAKSLAYTVSVFPSERRCAGLVGAYIATSPEREDEARAGLLAEFARLRTEPVTAEELSRAKAYALGTHAIRQQSGASVLGELLDAWLLGDGLHELETWPSDIASLSPHDLQRFAEQWFDASRVVEGIVRGAAGRSV
jgi:zinc protease